MENPFEFSVGSGSALCCEVRRLGFGKFSELADYVRSLPYCRTVNTVDPLAVLREQRGTCSSKHRLLALVAQESGHAEVSLTIGIYEMSERNTPGIGCVLNAFSMPYIPEAHCYLEVSGQRFDFTGLPPGQNSPFESLLLEHVVVPEQLSIIKEALHQEYIASWATAHGVSAASVWNTREACIEALITGRRLG